MTSARVMHPMVQVTHSCYNPSTTYSVKLNPFIKLYTSLWEQKFKLPKFFDTNPKASE
jgi:hypothetical protein